MTGAGMASFSLSCPEWRALIVLLLRCGDQGLAQGLAIGPEVGRGSGEIERHMFDDHPLLILNKLTGGG